jgi:tetratricopeptide (TPR) repeat protein
MSAPPPDLKSALAMMLRGGREALKLGSFDVAETLGREVLALDATNIEANVILGRALFYKKNYTQAGHHLSVGLAPTADADVWIELARAHQFQGHWPQAIAAFQTAYKLRAASAVQEAELGHAFSNNKQLSEAAAAFARSTALDSKNAEVWNDLGAMYLELADLDAAQRCFEAAVELKPNYLEALNNLGLVHEFKGEGAAVLAVAERIAAINPNDPAHVQKRGVSRLSQGHLVSGWKDYRARFSNPAHKGWHVGIPKPMWDGIAPLTDIGILVWSDQGLGDQILTASLLPDVVAAAERVVFSCEPRLAALIERSFPQVRAVSLFDVPLRRVDVSETDVQASISELGPAFRPDMTRFPKHSGYLKADPTKVAELMARYAALSSPGEKRGPVIGISWHSTNELARGKKSVALDQWAPILNAPGVRFVSLQYGDVAAEVATSGKNIFIDHAVDAVKDVDLFAAQVAAMDVVISTSNTTVHMAGALGVPTLCLTPLGEGRPWYWFVGHEVSPWYPSVRHIWQTKRGQWGDVLERAATSMQNMLQSNR